MSSNDHELDKTPSRLEEARTLNGPDSPVAVEQLPDAPVAHGDEHWTQRDVQTIPENNLWIVFPALMLAVFLVSLDQTIIGIALPTIVHALGSSNGYAWAGSAYTLTTGALYPLWGILSELTGRKPLLYLGIVFFLFGSALSGAAQSMRWLIAARAVQGIGGGALASMVQVIIGDIVPLDKRAQYSGGIGVTFGVAAVLGPVVGGIFADKVSWRWIFFINLPTGGIAGLILLRLKLNPVPKRSFLTHMAEFDFIGLFLVTAAALCLLLGFTFGATSWSSPATITLVAISPVLFTACIMHELYTTKRPVIPPRLFRTRTTSFLLVSIFIQAFTYFATAYYLPLYFQVRGASALLAGCLMIPYSLGSSITGFLTGVIVVRTASYRPTLWVGWALSLLGAGLMINLDETSNRAKEILYSIIAAIGIGCLFQTPVIGMQAATSVKDMATVTATAGLVRQLGGTIGISGGGAVFLSFLRGSLDSIEGYDGRNIPDGDLLNNVGNIASIEPESVREQVVRAYARSLAKLWLICTPMIGVAFILMMFIRAYSLKRPAATATSQALDPNTTSDEKKAPEAGAET